VARGARYNDVSSIMTFPAVLYASGEIRFQYLRMTGNSGNSTKFGIQDSSRTVGLPGGINQPFVRDSPRRAHPARAPRGGGRSPQGFLAPGAHQSVNLLIDASGLAPGTTTRVARLESNARPGADTSVAVTLQVSGAPDIALSPAALEFGAHFTGAPTIRSR